MDKAEILGWYWDVIMASNDALAKSEFEYYEGLEEWRRALKGEAGL